MSTCMFRQIPVPALPEQQQLCGWPANFRVVYGCLDLHITDVWLCGHHSDVITAQCASGLLCCHCLLPAPEMILAYDGVSSFSFSSGAGNADDPM